MKKTKRITILALTGFVTSVYAEENKASTASANPYEGYWVQFDEDNDSGKGKVQGVIHTYLATNNEYGKKGTLEMAIAVPIMKIGPKGNITAPDAHFQKGGAIKSVSGEINGFKYDYSSDKSNFTQGLVFSGNLQKQSNGSYDNGGVLNPNDGKTYNASARVTDGGKTLDASAYKGSGWYSVGKDAHWKKITKKQYEDVKAQCGFDEKTGAFPYQDNSKDAESKFKACYNYYFGVVNPVN